MQRTAVLRITEAVTGIYLKILWITGPFSLCYLMLIHTSGAGSWDRNESLESLKVTFLDPGSPYLAYAVELLRNAPEVLLTGQGVQLVLHIIHELLQ